jgi:hypothetical protein
MICAVNSGLNHNLHQIQSSRGLMDSRSSRAAGGGVRVFPRRRYCALNFSLRLDIPGVC